MKTALAATYLRRHGDAVSATGAVTVLQPILSGDPELETMLRHNLAVAPPSTRFLHLIDTDDAEAQRITDRLRSEFPPERLEVLFCPPVERDVNPKSAKLALGLERVHSEYVAVLDDDTLLQPDHLGFALEALASCDLYTGLPSYLPGKNVWSALVRQFVNDNSILTYLPLAQLLPPLTINGMFYVLRTATLREVGGFTAIAGELCDDYAVAKRLRAQGRVIRQGTALLSLRTTVGGGGHYLRLLHRWHVFALFQVLDQPLGRQTLLTLLLGAPPLLLWLGLLTSPASVTAGLVTLVGLAGRQMLHELLACQPRLGRLREGHGGREVLLSIVSELLQPVHLLHALLRKQLFWRNRKILLRRDGTFEYVR